MMPRPHLQKLAERARMLPALPAAVVFPVDRDSLQLALSAAFAGYLAPTLYGPEGRVRDAANRAGLDISRLPLVDTPDDPRLASERAALAARLARYLHLERGFAWDMAFESRIAALTPADVHAALRRHLALERLAVAKAGDFK